MHTIEITITKEDLARVELYSGQSMNEAVLDADKPQGFTVTSEDGATVTNFKVPDALRKMVYRLPDEQRHLVICYLAAEKLRALPGDTLVRRVAFHAEDLGYEGLHETRDVLTGLQYLPVKAEILRGYLLNILAAYTKSS